MDPQVQASFIPKKPLTTNTAASQRSVGVIWFVSLAILVLSVAGAAGAFAYETYLESVIKSDSESLTRAQAAYDPSVIESLVRLDARIKEATTLLKNHLSPSVIFTLLENNTLSSVRFTGFEYSVNSSGIAALTLTGETLDFSSIALQADAFSASKALRNVLFSDINVQPATGHITFKVQATIEPSLLLFSNTLTAGKTSGGSGTSGGSTATSTQSSGAAGTGATTTPPASLQQ